MNLVDYLLPFIALIILGILLLPRIRANTFWQATVTPLASIIGSGFLIVAPLLGEIVGSLTPVAMLGIVVFAYVIGGVIRFNIRHAEPLITDAPPTSLLTFLERLSNWILFGAYVTSVAFYLRLMSAFVLQGFGMFNEVNANVLTTVVLVFIGITGWRHGLKGLEVLEKYSVSVKLAIIGVFLFALFMYDSDINFMDMLPQAQEHSTVKILRLLAGMLLVVQGFETSRYLGEEYTSDVRLHSMRFAQILSAIIYICFAILILPLIHFLPSGHMDETAIIGLSRHASVVLPLMLIGAAVMSQFSAAVADTLGSGGLLFEESRKRVSTGKSYLIVTGAAIVLIWSTNIFEIIAFASRAFAFYYFTQTVLAFQVVRTWPEEKGKGWHLVAFGLMACVLAAVTVFAIPVG